MPRISQQGIGGILAEFRASIIDDAAEKVVALERQQKDAGKQLQGRDAPELSDAAPTQQGADLEIVKERSNLIVQTFCFVLFVKLLYSVVQSSSALILLRISQSPIYQEVKSFSR